MYSFFTQSYFIFFCCLFFGILGRTGKNSKTIALLFNSKELKVQETWCFSGHQGGVCPCLSGQQVHEVINSRNYIDFLLFNPTPYSQSIIVLIVYLQCLIKYTIKILIFSCAHRNVLSRGFKTLYICLIGLEIFIFWSNFHFITLFSMLRLVCSCLSGVSVVA